MNKNLKYIAHKDNYREQSVKEHLYGTADKAAEFADKFGKADWGYCCGLLHDIGKYSKEFQNKIINDTDDKVDHSTAGAKLCMELGGYYQLLSYCIAGHHAGMPDYGNTGIHSSLRYRCEKKKICDYSSYKYDIEIPELNTEPIMLRNLSDADFPLSVFLRMIYSCLVDADFLDTEYFMKNGDVNRNSGENVEILLNKLENHISEWLKNDNKESLNGRRTEILKHCLNEGQNKKGFFRLTVPTGGGKTIASLAFALKHAVENDMDRVIYVIPYTSIIEQNAQVFRDILGEQNVLENHCNVDYDGREDFVPMQLASENWDKPIVVTTNVQFFESLFSNKSSRCRKLHNIANSVIIFDEVQMLPTDYLKPCIYMISELVKRYRYSIYPIEYKKGKPKVSEEDKLQLVVQAMALEEMFSTQIEEGAIYYGETRRREVVQVSQELRDMATKMFGEMHDYFKRGYTPQVKQSKACNSCSLKDICLPKLNKAGSVKNYISQMLGENVE